MSIHLIRRSNAFVELSKRPMIGWNPCWGTITATSKSVTAKNLRLTRQRHLNTSNSAKTESVKPQQVSVQDANAGMADYMDARELLRKGKLAKVSATRKTATAAQAGILVVFLAAFIASPFIGKKIAQDEEFRTKYIPSWYDFTVKRPENAWTRDELHEQMLQVHKDIHERAIAGEFTPEKLQELQNAMQSPNSSSNAVIDDLYHPYRKGMDRNKVPKEWDMVHPGLDAGEDLDETGS